jgi:hypothetical protein
MAFDLYKYAMAAVTFAIILIWNLQSRWAATDLFALIAFISPLYAPFLYVFGKRLWVARKRRRLGLPAASDRDIIGFVGEELDRVGIAWQWCLSLRGTSRWDELEIGEEDEPSIFVRIRDGVLNVSNEDAGATYFADPVEAVDYALNLYDGRKKPDESMFVETEEGVE